MGRCWMFGVSKSFNLSIFRPWNLYRSEYFSESRNKIAVSYEYDFVKPLGIEGYLYKLKEPLINLAMGIILSIEISTEVQFYVPVLENRQNGGCCEGLVTWPVAS